MSGNLLLAVLVLFPFVCAAVCWFVGEKNDSARSLLAELAVITEFVMMAAAALTDLSAAEAGVESTCQIAEVCGMGLFLSIEGFRLVYGLVAAFMWMMAVLMSREYMSHHGNRNRYYFFMLMTLGATMGVFLSEDLYTTFIFFEIMSFTSYVWVAQEETKGALRAAETYLAVAVTGGLVLLMGLFMLYHELGTLNIDELQAAAAACPNKTLLYAAASCILFGFGAKAGAFPLHIWLPKAHPVAPAPASALLSGILTKSGVFGIIVISCHLMFADTAWGILILALGVLTMFGGAMLAVFSIDLKRTLACSSMSQIGFIMIGIGSYDILTEENFLAAHGAMLHMVNHSLIKLVLFLAAGVVYMNCHSLDLNKVRGFGRRKPFLMVCFLVGALAIGGIPMFGGYVSKTLLHEGIIVMELGAWTTAVEWIFLFSGGMTVAYMTKLFIAIFIEENPDKALQQKYDSMKKYMDLRSTIALGGSAIVLFIWGIIPHVFMDSAARLGEKFFLLEESGETIHYFSLENLKGALISIAIGALLYIFFIRNVLMVKEEGMEGAAVIHDIKAAGGAKAAGGFKEAASSRTGHVSSAGFLSNDRVYRNCWPKWFDMEDLLYRPLLLKILPTFFGVLCRICDSFIDTLVVVLRKTLYRDSPLPRDPKTATGRQVRIREDIKIVRSSLSYGFVLFGIGVMLTLVYILFW